MQLDKTAAAAACILMQFASFSTGRDHSFEINESRPFTRTVLG